MTLAACGTEPTDTAQGSGGKTQQKNSLILYKSDANAEEAMPFEEAFDGNKSNLIPFIFSKVNEHDVKLLDYKLENENTSLILDIGDDVYSIQGSAGARMFVETLARSYFENMPELQDITFTHKGSYEAILDHMNIGEPYSRQDFNM